MIHLKMEMKICVTTELNLKVITKLQENDCFKVKVQQNYISCNLNVKWRPPSLSELTSMVFNMRLTHLGSEASKCWVICPRSTISFRSMIFFLPSSIFTFGKSNIYHNVIILTLISSVTFQEINYKSYMLLKENCLILEEDIILC